MWLLKMQVSDSSYLENLDLDISAHLVDMPPLR